MIDLGLAGSEAYDRWERRFGCSVVPVGSLRRGLEDIFRVRELIARGKGRLIDRAGIDWWETPVLRLQGQLEKVARLRRLAESLAGEEVHITRPGFDADALQQMLGNRLRIYAAGGGGPLRSWRIARKFPAWQVAQILGDKYDPALKVRSRFARRVRGGSQTAVLVPTAYISVTRTGIDYASTAPGLNFLLVAARRSGWSESLPSNMRAEWLASYAKQGESSAISEYPELCREWGLLRPELEEELELKILSRLGLLNDFPKQIEIGLQRRAAWETVFRRESIQSVFCADDSNPWTRIPLLLAKKFGVPAVACHHGALDAQYMMKETLADVVLAKGEMERDYLVRVCGVPAEKVEIGAPALRTERMEGTAGASRGSIVFFSELYDAFSARAEEFYRDLLPPLVEIAVVTGKRVVVKLHPAESENDRRRLVRRVLTADQQLAVEVVSGPLKSELLQKAWFGITALSTVASECALAGVPCFLCRWLEFAHYGYQDQFARFGAGYELKTRAEIAEIPRILENYSVGRGVADNLFQVVERQRIEELLSCRGLRAADVAAGMQRAQ